MHESDRPRRAATVRDVANLARVSPQTVSNVLNGRTSGLMTEATRLEVVDAIRALNYRRNVNAIRLRQGRARTIAFAILDPSDRFLADAFTAEMLAGAAEYARRRGYHLLLEAVNPTSPELGEQVAGSLLFHQADGLILLPSGSPEAWLPSLEAASKTGRPVILLSSTAASLEGVGSIRADDEKAGRLIAEHLAALGHSRFAFVQSAVEWPAVQARLSGVNRALKRAGCPPCVLVTAADWTVDAGRSAVQLALESFPPGRRPTAVIAGNDVLAAGAIVAARSAGLSLPAELSITGFDDLDFASALEPALTTARVNGMAMGRGAAHDLLSRIEKPWLPARRRVMRTSLVVRSSTSAPPRQA